MGTIMEEIYCGEYRGPAYKLYVWAYNTGDFLSKAIVPATAIKLFYDLGWLSKKAPAVVVPTLPTTISAPNANSSIISQVIDAGSKIPAVRENAIDKL